MKNDLVDLLVSPIGVLELSIRPANALKRAGIETVIHLMAYDGYELGKRIFDFGPKKRNEAESSLLRHNLRLGLARDYREQIEALQPGQSAQLRDIATAFARSVRPDIKATADDKPALAQMIMDPLKTRLMQAFTAGQLQDPRTSEIIARHLDDAISRSVKDIRGLDAPKPQP